MRRLLRSLDPRDRAVVLFGIIVWCACLLLVLVS